MHMLKDVKGAFACNPYACNPTCSRRVAGKHAVVQALVEAGATQHGIPTSGGTREGRLSSDAVCEASIALVATIFEGVKMAGDGPLIALSV